MPPLFKLRFFDVPIVQPNVLAANELNIYIEDKYTLCKFSMDGKVVARYSDFDAGSLSWRINLSGVWITDWAQFKNRSELQACLLDKVSLKPIGGSTLPLGRVKDVIDLDWFVGAISAGAGVRSESFFSGCYSDNFLYEKKSVVNVGFIECTDGQVFVSGAYNDEGEEGLAVFDRQLNELWRKFSTLTPEITLHPQICGEYIFWPVGEGRDEKRLRYFELALLNKITGEQLWARRITPLPQEITIFDNVIYWVSGSWASDSFRSAIHRIDLISGEDMEPISMLPYERNGSAIYQIPSVNDKYIVCCNALGMRIVILDRKTLAHLQTIDFPEGSYNPSTGSFSVWHGDSLFFRALPVKDDLWTACTAVAVLSPYDGGEVFNPCVRPSKTEECIKIPTDKKPLHEYTITLHEAMPTPELIRWSHIFVGELLATKCDAYTNQKTTMNKQFNGRVHLRIPKQGLEEDADAEMKKMAEYIEKSFFHQPYRGGRNKVLIEYFDKAN